MELVQSVPTPHVAKSWLVCPLYLWQFSLLARNGVCQATIPFCNGWKYATIMVIITYKIHGVWSRESVSLHLMMLFHRRTLTTVLYSLSSQWKQRGGSNNISMLIQSDSKEGVWKTVVRFFSLDFLYSYLRYIGLVNECKYTRNIVCWFCMLPRKAALADDVFYGKKR